MTEKVVEVLPHIKAPGFVSISATGAAISVHPDGTHQLTFYAVVTDLESETMTLSPAGDTHKLVETTFKASTVREDLVRVNMGEEHMRNLANLLAGKFGLAKKKSNGGDNA